MRIDRRLLRLAQTEHFTLGLAIFLGLISGAGVVIQARYFSQTVSRVYLDNGDLRDVKQVLAALLVVICVRAVLVFCAEKSASLAAIRIITRLRQQLYEHILNLGPVFMRQERTGELISVCLQGVDALEAYFSKYLPQLAIAILVPLTYLVLIFPLDKITGLVLLLTAPLIPIFMILIGSLGESLTERQWHTLRRLSAYFYDLLQGLTTLKTMG